MLAIQNFNLLNCAKLVIDEYLNIVIAQLIEVDFVAIVPDVCDESALPKKCIYFFVYGRLFESRPREHNRDLKVLDSLVRKKGERRDSNPRPPEPQSGALTN